MVLILDGEIVQDNDPRAIARRKGSAAAPQRASVWGWATSSDPLTLTLTPSSGGGSSQHAATLSQYNSSAYTWSELLPATPADNTTSYTLAIGGASIDDVLFGGKAPGASVPPSANHSTLPDRGGRGRASVPPPTQSLNAA